MTKHIDPADLFDDPPEVEPDADLLATFAACRKIAAEREDA